ncbi:MAG: HAMP domain-containing protein [Deltaproteobacteria bacterium]|nr:HAMP domain-containing protein [Deltaproteobacteria bacterium]
MTGARIGWRLFATLAAGMGLSLCAASFVLTTALPRTVRIVLEPELRAALIAALAMGGCFALGVSVVVARRFSRSARALRDAVTQFGNGVFTHRIVIRRYDELGGLADDVNTLATQLEQRLAEHTAAHERLQAILQGLSDGVLVTNARHELTLANPQAHTLLQLPHEAVGQSLRATIRDPLLHDTIGAAHRDRQPTACELAVSHGSEPRSIHVQSVPIALLHTAGLECVSVLHDVTAFRALETMRRDFVANVAHELRTPLTSIRGYAETLRDGAWRDAATALPFLEKIERSAIHLQRLVEQMLRLAAIEAGHIAVDRQSIAVGPLCERVIADLAPLTDRRRLTLHVTTEPRDLMVAADPTLLTQIIRNLVENAIQWTPDGGRIDVTATENADQCRIAVRDTGVGIPATALERIFERFFRVPQASIPLSAGGGSASGGGLGLAIVKHLVQLHDGTITVQSTPRQGSCFTVQLPKTGY